MNPRILSTLLSKALQAFTNRGGGLILLPADTLFRLASISLTDRSAAKDGH